MTKLKLEYCKMCDEPTGRAGAGDDSIYLDDGRGPLCERCYGDFKSADMLAADAQDSINQLCGPAAFARNQAQQVAVPQDQYTVIGWMVGYDSRVYDKPVLGATPVYTRHAAPPQADAPEQDDDERLDEMVAMAVWEDEP